MKSNIIKNKYYLILPYIIVAMLCLKISNAAYILLATMLPIVLVFLFKFKGTINKKYMYLLLAILVYIPMCIINTDILSAIKGFLPILNLVVPILIYDSLISKSINNNENMKNIKNLFIVLLVYTISITWYYLSTDIYFARNLANHNELSTSTYTGLAVASGGGYVLVYGLAIIPVIVLALLKKNKNTKKQKFLYVSIILLLLMFIIKANFATAFILIVASLILGVLKFNKKNKVILISFLILITIIGLLNIQIILEYTVKILPDNSIISIRLNEILEYTEASGNVDTDTSFYGRIMLLNKSFNSIIKKPLGIAYTNNFNYVSMQDELGLHNEWIDLIGKYGIIVGGLVLLFVATSLNQFRKDFKESKYSYEINITIGIITVLGFLNPINATTILLLEFVFIPCLISNKNEYGDMKQN